MWKSNCTCCIFPSTGRVTELDIPEDSVLDISETLSGMARATQIKQGRLRMQQQQCQQGLQQAIFNVNFRQVSEQS